MPRNLAGSVNNPHLLILQAPYYSMTDMIQNICPVIPRFLIKYKLETYKYITNCRMPIVIFHGDADMVINYKNSIMLSSLFKKEDSLVILTNEGHNDITYNEQYKQNLIDLLSK